ncbi:MAG: hypothetical protein KAX49_17805 [Halanaerobiales bacterium]|nr:hypothetical protein [Halanaerobiales bacterium]
MESTINVCFLSRNRIKKLIEGIEAVKRNSIGVDYKISLLFDDDEKSYNHFKSLGYSCYIFTPRQECVKMTNNCYKITKELGFNYFVFLNDDMVPQKDWLKFALEDYISTFKDGEGVISFNFMPGGEILCCAGLTTVKFIDNTLQGVFFNELFIHNEGDSEFSYRAIKHKKLKWCEKSKVKHNHYTKNPKLMDSTYSDSGKHFFSDLKKREDLIGDGIVRN